MHHTATGSPHPTGGNEEKHHLFSSSVLFLNHTCLCSHAVGTTACARYTESLSYLFPHSQHQIQFPHVTDITGNRQSEMEEEGHKKRAKDRERERGPNGENVAVLIWLHRAETSNRRVKCFVNRSTTICYIPWQYDSTLQQSLVTVHSALLQLYSSNEPGHINNCSPKCKKNNLAKVGVSCSIRLSSVQLHFWRFALCLIVFCSAPFNGVLSCYILPCPISFYPAPNMIITRNSGCESCFKLQLCGRMESVNRLKLLWTYSLIRTRGSHCQGLAIASRVMTSNFHSGIHHP